MELWLSGLKGLCLNLQQRDEDEAGTDWRRATRTGLERGRICRGAGQTLRGAWRSKRRARGKARSRRVQLRSLREVWSQPGRGRGLRSVPPDSGRK